MSPGGTPPSGQVPEAVPPGEARPEPGGPGELAAAPGPVRTRPPAAVPAAVAAARWVVRLRAVLAVVTGALLLAAGGLTGTLRLTGIGLLLLGAGYLFLAGRLGAPDGRARLATVWLLGLDLAVSVALLGRGFSVAGGALAAAGLYLLVGVAAARDWFGGD